MSPTKGGLCGAWFSATAAQGPGQSFGLWAFPFCSLWIEKAEKAEPLTSPPPEPEDVAFSYLHLLATVDTRLQISSKGVSDRP